MSRQAKPILDTETGKEYSSMYHAGQELAPLVGGDTNDRFVFFKLQRAFPDRFPCKDVATGKWIALQAAPRTSHARKAHAESAAVDNTPTDATPPTVDSNAPRSGKNSPTAAMSPTKAKPTSTKRPKKQSKTSKVR